VEFPRSLTARERATLDFLLSADVPGVEALRIQARSVRATGRCSCGCPSIHLRVDSEQAPHAAGFPVISSVSDPEDSGETLWLLLFVEGGRLSYLEIAWIAERAPNEFPAPDLLESFEPPSI
jgi:hypothetical protein